jgi:hypothetical protein
MKRNLKKIPTRYPDDLGSGTDGCRSLEASPLHLHCHGLDARTLATSSLMGGALLHNEAVPFSSRHHLHFRSEELRLQQALHVGKLTSDFGRPYLHAAALYARGQLWPVKAAEPHPPGVTRDPGGIAARRPQPNAADADASLDVKGNVVAAEV